MRYMLDTNFCIYLIRRHPREVLAKRADCVENDVVMSAITLAELRYGVECRAADRTEDQVAALLEAVPAVAFDQDAAAATVESALPRASTPLTRWTNSLPLMR